MACENCTQKAIENNAKHIKTQEEAQALANRTGEWVGIYTDEGATKYAAGPDTAGKPIEQWVTPDKNMRQHQV